MNKILVFTSEVCNPCKVLKNNLKDIDTNYNIIYYDVYATECADLINTFNIKAVPTIIVLDTNNNVICNNIGLPNKNRLQEILLMGNCDTE